MFEIIKLIFDAGTHKKFILISMNLSILISGSCAPSLFIKPSGVSIDAGEVLDNLKSMTSKVETNQKLLKLKVYDDGKTYLGEALYLYQYPDNYRLNILTPFGTTFMEIIERGGNVEVRPESRYSEVFGDMQISSGGFLGWLTGFYEIGRIIDSNSIVQASREPSAVLLSIYNGETVHQFTMDLEMMKVVKYISEKNNNPIGGVSFYDFKLIEGIPRAMKMVYIDYSKNREVTSTVTSEKINQVLSENSFEFSLTK